MAEVVMIPVVAALVNAIAHATGYRFRDLPVRAENIREVLSIHGKPSIHEEQL
ncbi:Uncharacterised protein [Budvicia aquatica]|nr:hypothetical protein [Budvicia aquatica]VFS49240.1 Uncharacterised protein [Budvicia aquatica]